MTTLEIGLTITQTSDELFEDTTGADVEASIARFDTLLLAAVREAFPGAVVNLAPTGYVFDETIGSSINPADTDETHHAWQRIQALADDIHQRGDWIVEQERL